MTGEQLALAVSLPQAIDFDDYVGEAGAEAVAALRAGASLYLVGPAGVGKSHLLLATVSRHGGTYLPLSLTRSHGADALEGLAADQPLALDECEALPPEPSVWQRLLRLLDQRSGLAHPTWLAGRLPPEALDPLPADLRTRLSLWPRYPLAPLSEAGQRQLLERLARRHGLELDAPLFDWWLAHRPRDPASLRADMARLDRMSLKARRRPTLAFLRAVLEPPPVPDA